MKLQKMIDLLHRRYSQEELQNLEQYQRLMSLYESLKPLLPQGSAGDLQMVEEPSVAATGTAGDPEQGVVAKRSPFNMDFMGKNCLDFTEYVQFLKGYATHVDATSNAFLFKI